MKKLWLILVLSLFCAFCSVGFAACHNGSARQIIHDGCFYFVLLEDDSYGIIGSDETTVSENVIIPAKFKGKCVTSIGNEAFRGCSKLTSITIPDGLTNIGEYAFYNCSKLTSITIPDSVKSIGEMAFSGCRSLTSINVSENNANYKSIDGNLYSKDGETLILYAPGKTATTFIIPDSVASIGDGAFSGCSSLTSITIPDSVTSIGGGAFDGCSSLTSITIPDSVTSIGNCAFYGCISLTSVNIGGSVTSIGYGAFLGCSKLTSITIPDSVTSIGGSAFSYCTSLTSITFNGTKSQWQAISKGEYWKAGVPSSCKVHCTDGDINI